MLIATQAFKSLAEAVAKAFGYPDLPMVIVPHPFETLSKEEVERITDEVIPDVVAVLSGPRLDGGTVP